MNYYERIQESMNYIEENLLDTLSLEECAKKAYMSLAVFYRIFFAVVGYTPKEYIRHRRISLASEQLGHQNSKVIDVALSSGYESVDAFSRAFRTVTGFLPDTFKKENHSFCFERMDIMDQYFEIQDQELLNQYPDIKVLKKMEPMRVASYKAFSLTPEDDSFDYIQKWAKEKGLLDLQYGYRIFGFDVAGSLKPDGQYGYEVWMTIPQDFDAPDDLVEIKEFDGGYYAVTTTTIRDISATWNRFREWLKLSKYDLGEHQWLEEHLSFDKWSEYRNQEDMKVDLYMPIKEEEVRQKRIIAPVTVAYYRAKGENAAMEAWNTMLEWAKSNHLNPKKHRIYVYNNGFRKTKNPWHEVMITIEDSNTYDYGKVQKKQFEGGNYMAMKSNRSNLPNAWREMGRWGELTKTKMARHQ